MGGLQAIRLAVEIDLFSARANFMRGERLPAVRYRASDHADCTSEIGEIIGTIWSLTKPIQPILQFRLALGAILYRERASKIRKKSPSEKRAFLPSRTMIRSIEGITKSR